MSIPPHIRLEMEELAKVPKEPISKFYQGQVARCSICGKLVPVAQLDTFDKNRRNSTRKACQECRGRE